MVCPLVSICIPVYGVEKYIERCARSLFEQTYQNIEYIFVNDCTKDASIEILRKIITEYPNRKDCVKIIDHEKNLGLGGARNTAVEYVSGDFLMWVDSDDYLDIECVEKVLTIQMKTNADIVAFDAYYDYDTYKGLYSNRLSDDAHEACLDICACRAKHMVWGRLYRANLYIDNHIKVKVGCNMGEDYQVVPALYYFAEKVAVLNEPLYYYYKGNAASYTGSFSEKNAKQWLESIDILLCFFENKEESYRKAVRIGAAVLTSQLMAGCCRNGNKNMYAIIRKHLDDTEPSVVKLVPKSYRIYFYLKSRALLMLYTKIGHFIKSRKK